MVSSRDDTNPGSGDDSQAERPTADDDTAEVRSEPKKQPPQTVSPIPPAPPGQQVQVALGMQLIQQSALDNLQPEIQTQLIELAAAMDRHAFENAQESLKGETELSKKRLEDQAAGRKQALTTLSVLAILALAAGTGITILLILAGEHQMGHTVMMSGLAVVSALLGGAGLSAIFRK